VTEQKPGADGTGSAAYHGPVPIDSSGESFVALQSLLDQIVDNDSPAESRIHATIAAQQFLESLTRTLVNEALEAGTNWDDLAAAFGTTPANVKSRFGALHNYDDA
jgi:hypothetical protein